MSSSVAGRTSIRWSSSNMEPDSLRDRAHGPGDHPGATTLGLGALLADERRADRRAAEKSQRLGRDPWRRRVDEWQPRRLVVAIQRDRSEAAADHLRRRDAVARVAIGGG